MDEGKPSRDPGKKPMDKRGPSGDPGKKPMDEGGPSRDPADKGEDLELAAAAPARCWSPWVILPAIPRVTDNEKKHLVPGTDLSLQFAEPPRATMLTVARRINPGSVTTHIPYIIDVLPSGCFLLCTTHGGYDTSVYYMCDAHTRVATRLPPSLERPIVPRRSIGFMDDPRHRGHYLVAQLHPTSTTQHKALVYYSTLTKKWDVKHLASCPHHQLWGCDGRVLAHDGKLWWADSPYGFLTCDPFTDEVHLRYVALPEGCIMVGADTIPSRENLDKHRFVKVSEGKLRYVQIHGLPDEPVVSLWTLVDPEGPVWKLEYEVRLEEIWGDDSYKEAGLTPGKVPAIALIDPNNHGVLYLLQGCLLFAVDMRASTNRILHCEEFVLGNDLEEWEMYHASQFVHAWELPPTLLRFEPPTDIGSKDLNKSFKIITSSQAAREFFTAQLQAIRDTTHDNKKNDVSGKDLNKSSDCVDRIGQSNTSTVITAGEAAREFFTAQLQAIRANTTHDKENDVSGKDLNKSSYSVDRTGQSNTSTVITAGEAAREFFTLQLQAIKSAKHNKDNEERPVTASTEVEAASEVNPEAERHNDRG